jgi:hypothetical protein
LENADPDGSLDAAAVEDVCDQLVALNRGLHDNVLTHLRLLSDPASGHRTGSLCYAARGFSLHAARQVSADQRHRLEELCRYILRPPLANHRLRWLSDSELVFKLKRAWSDGTTHVIFSPHELLERLATSVPPRRANVVRYHGVLAPNASWRQQIVPTPPETSSTDGQLTSHHPAEPRPGSPPARRHRIPWAELFKRVFKEEVDRCACGGRLRLVAFLTEPSSIMRYLEGMGLPTTIPEIASARAPPQMAIEWD